MGIRAHKPARPEHHAAEIAGDYHDAVGHAALLEHIERGYARRALGLAVVGIPLNAALAQDIGIDIVGRVPVLFGYLRYEIERLLLSRDGRSVPDEA